MIVEFTEVIRIFTDGIDNILATDIKEIEKANYKLRTLKMILFYIITALFSKKKDLTNQIYFIGRPDKEHVFSQNYSGSKIYRQRCINNFKDIRNKTTTISVFKRNERLKLIFQSINIGRKLIKQSIIKKEYLSYWVDFYIMWRFLEAERPDLVIHRFHYDEKATWIGELKKGLKYDVYIYQHGVVTGELNLPHRILADRFFCFDQYSMNYFKKEVLDDDIQEVTVYDFPDTIEFTVTSEVTKYKHIIGIAEQCDEKWTTNLVRGIIEKNNDCMVYIMLHPQSRADYSCFDKYSNIKATTKKIENLDIIVTYNSTLIIDYYRHNNSYTIFFMSEKDREMYQDYPFIYTKNIDDIVHYV